MKKTSPYNFNSDDILKNIVEQVVKISSPDKIILFGSRAKGTNRADSDYDICVLKSRLKKRRKLAQKIYLNLDVLASVDVIVNTPARYKEIKDSPFLIYHEIEKNGEVIYEKK